MNNRPLTRKLMSCARTTKKLTTVALACALAAGLASADTLHDMYLRALENDPTLKAANATYKAARAGVMLSASALLPRITYTDNDTDTEVKLGSDTLNTDSASQTYQGSLRVFDLAAWFNLGQARNLSEAQRHILASQQQNLILRLTEAYLNTLTATQTLRVARAEEAAFKQQLDKINEEYALGMINITETHEAQLQYDLTRVRLIDSIGQVEIARQALAEIVGFTPEELIAISDDYPVQMPEPKERKAWVDAALANNPDLSATSERTRAAKNAKRASLAGHLPVVELIGSQSEDSSYNFGVGGQLSTESDTTGVRITVPILSGGGDLARQRRASYEHQSAHYQEEAMRRAIIRNARSQHQRVETALHTLQARNQAVLSAQSAFTSAEVGYEVGTRNIVDLLSSQRQLYAAQRDAIESRHLFIYSVFQLKALTGALSPQDVIDLSVWQK